MPEKVSLPLPWLSMQSWRIILKVIFLLQYKDGSHQVPTETENQNDYVTYGICSLIIASQMSYAAGHEMLDSLKAYT